MKKSTKKPKQIGASSNPAAPKVKRKTASRRALSPIYVGAKLSAKGRKTLKRMERTIARGLAEFVKVGKALVVIRDERLYKASHRRFEEYCKSHWKFSAKQAYRFIAGAEIVEELRSGKGRVPRFKLPTRESQVRPLARLCGESRCKPISIWKQALEEANGKAPSAALVSKLVNDCLGKLGSLAARRRRRGVPLSPNGKLANIRKLLAKSAAKSGGRGRKLSVQTMRKLMKLVGEPKV